MIQWHVWQLCTVQPGSILPLFYSHVALPLGGYAAPLFVLISGLSTHLAFERRRSNATGRRSLSTTLLRRGIALFSLATVINGIAGPILHVPGMSLLNWGAIQLLGLCLCLAVPFVRLNWVGKAIWVAISLAISTWASSAMQPSSPLFRGFAPPFPWSSLFFIGMMVGNAYTWCLKSSYLRRSSLLFLIGLVLIVPVGTILNSVYYPFSWAHTAEMSLTSFLVFVGIFLLLLVLVGYLIDIRRPKSGTVKSVIGLGQHSLTVYYLQLAGIVVGPMLINSILGYSIRIDANWFLPLVLLVLLALHIVINGVWRRFDYALSLEWWLSRWVAAGWRTG